MRIGLNNCFSFSNLVFYLVPYLFSNFSLAFLNSKTQFCLCIIALLHLHYFVCIHVYKKILKYRQKNQQKNIFLHHFRKIVNKLLSKNYIMLQKRLVKSYQNFSEEKNKKNQYTGK